MMRTLSTLLSLCMVLATLLTGGCDNTETRTQLTFAIAASPGLQTRTSILRVVVRSNTRGDQMREFRGGDLNWPVEIVVIPEGNNDSRDEVTLFATAYDAMRVSLAEKSATGTFSPGRAKQIEVALDNVSIDGGPARDAGGGNERDASTLDAGGETPGPDAQVDVPPEDSGTDPGVVNCASANSDIKCDDDNACNGVERCAPDDVMATSNGCVPGSNAVTCAMGSICDGKTGLCSTCLANGDGDGDGVNAVACGGMDCNDNDKTIAPGKPELCDNKDNNCDSVVDGVAANAACAPSAPTGGVSTCGMGGICQRSCTTPNFVINASNVCVAPTGTCPIINPCGPGTCAGAVGGGYTCTCPAGFRAGLGMTRCAPIGVARNIGFESACDGMALPGAFVNEVKALAATQFAACGLASVASGAMMAAPQLIQPTTTVIAGITKDSALALPLSMAGTSVLVLTFTPGVNFVSFDALDIDNAMGLSVVATTASADLPTVSPVPAAGTKRAAVSITSATPITRVTVIYTQMTPTDALYIDELNFRVNGCGDKVADMMAGEACDDGNAVQCDGCDNACALAAAPACTP